MILNFIFFIRNATIDGITTTSAMVDAKIREFINIVTKTMPGLKNSNNRTYIVNKKSFSIIHLDSEKEKSLFVELTKYHNKIL